MKNCFGIMKDADRLDRVRLAPDKIHSTEGLEIDRLTTIKDNEKREKYGKLACESLDTIIGILDCEQSLEQHSGVKMFLRQMIEKSEICVGLKGITSLVSKIKNQITNRNVKKEDKKINEAR